MGYTHYWSIKDGLTPEDIDRLRGDIEAVASASEIPLGDAYGDPGTLPEFSAERIWFNGVGDDSAETFGLEVGQSGFTFCKTYARPYDVVVTASLLVLKDVLGSRVRLTSDGDAPDWVNGLALAARATGRPIAPYRREAIT